MVRFDTLLKRLRKGEVRPQVRVQTGDMCESMTPTQAVRFRELQETRRGHKVKPHYSLKEAARLLKTDVVEILLSAAAGRVQCFVMSEGLRGHWRATGRGEPRLPVQPVATLRYLALSPSDCREIAANGSVNVYDLEYSTGPAPESDVVPATARFILREPLWVDPARIVLKHPLPK